MKPAGAKSLQTRSHWGASLAPWNIQGQCSSPEPEGRGPVCPSFGGFCWIHWAVTFSPQPRAMWWARLLLLLLLPTATLRPSWARPSQERAPLFRLTRRGPWGGGANDTTGSPCEGLFPAGATTLTLANRSLERLPSCLPDSLRSLDCSYNLLRSLSAPELGHLPELQVLTLRHNHVTELRWGPAALRTLDLSYNRLAALPLCTGPALGSLRALELAGNPLQKLPPRAFACFPALRLLNLSCTALGPGAPAGIADAAFAALATLEVLDLSGTFLTQGEPRASGFPEAGWACAPGIGRDFPEGWCPGCLAHTARFLSRATPAGSLTTRGLINSVSSER